MSSSVLHVISHTDLDGVAAAAVAWYRWKGIRPLRVSLAGYGAVDGLIMESLAAGQDFMAMDLFCQDARTVEAVDRFYSEGDDPLVFDHHDTTLARYGGRPWLAADASCLRRYGLLPVADRPGQRGLSFGPPGGTCQRQGYVDKRKPRQQAVERSCHHVRTLQPARQACRQPGGRA